MSKEEKIKEVYEKLGFDWDICSKYITENGVLILPTPDLKNTLKGYENLVKDKTKFSAFGKEGLKLQPSEISGIYSNNGWIKIESESDLPKIDFITQYWLTDGVSTWIETITLNHKIGREKVTHYQPIIKPQPPIY
jgi:hypothetical protein